MELTSEALLEIHAEAAARAANAANEDWQRAYGRLADAAEHLALRMNKHWRTPEISEAETPVPADSPV